MTSTAKQLAGLIMEADLPRRVAEMRWQDHIRAAIIDLRNSDRSPFEQEIYDVLRAFAERRLYKS